MIYKRFSTYHFLSFPPKDIFDNDRMGNAFESFYRFDNFYSPSRHIEHFFGQNARKYGKIRFFFKFCLGLRRTLKNPLQPSHARTP